MVETIYRSVSGLPRYTARMEKLCINANCGLYKNSQEQELVLNLANYLGWDFYDICHYISHDTITCNSLEALLHLFKDVSMTLSTEVEWDKADVKITQERITKIEPPISWPVSNEHSKKK